MALRLLAKSYIAHPVIWWIIGFCVAAFGVWAVVGVPSWIQGRWGRENAAMRYLFQCWGTPADEQARWEPRRVLVSACRQPLIVDVSPSGRLATVKVAQPIPQTLILDAQSGSVILTLEGPRGVLTLSDSLLYYTAGDDDHMLYDIILHQELPITKLPFQSEDVSILEQYRDEAQGNYEVYAGDVTLLVFNTPAGRRTFDIAGLEQEAYLKLIDDWQLKTRVVWATIDRPDNSPFRGGSRSCVLGRINPDLAGPGILEQIFAGVCWFEYTNPILLAP